MLLFFIFLKMRNPVIAVTVPLDVTFFICFQELFGLVWFDLLWFGLDFFLPSLNFISLPMMNPDTASLVYSLSISYDSGAEECVVTLGH